MSTWYLIRREAVDPASDDAAIDRLGIQEMLEACARVMATYDELVEAARIIRHGDEQEFKDGLYCLSLYNGEPELEAFAGCELEPGNDG